MRIAIVGTELCAVDSRGGGLEQVLRRWATALAERHDVTIVSHHPAGAPPVGPTAGVRTVTVAAPAHLGDVLGRLQPDVVSLHNRPQWAGHGRRAATTVTFHNYPQAWRLRRGHGRVDAELSAVSHALASAAADHLGRPPGSVTLTPPSVDPAFLAPPARRPEPIVLSPHRLMGKKGVRDLLAVAGRPEFASVTFAFADLISPWTRPTSEHRALRTAVRAVPNAVLFAPAVGAAALAERYATSAVVVCAVTEEEGLGLVALEAQACGAPLVTTDLGGLREATFAPNRCVPPHDLDALAAAIVAALGRRGSPAPRRQVLARYTPSPSGAVFEAWLLAAVERSSSAPGAGRAGR